MIRFFYAENTFFLNSKNQTNKHIPSQIHGGLVFISKSKIQSESKSQRICGEMLTGSRCLSVSQRYNLKANHNYSKQHKKMILGVYQ